MRAGWIRHTVAFSLRHERGSGGGRVLIEAAKLASIAGVDSFDILAEVGPKNDFRYGISMEFARRAAYDGYNTTRTTVRCRRGAVGARRRGLP